MVFRANFEVWDHRNDSATHGPECVSRHRTLVEAERSLRDSRDPRMLTIYDAEGRVRGMFRDGKPVTDESVAAVRGEKDERRCICGKPIAHVDADPELSDWACRIPEAG